MTTNATEQTEATSAPRGGFFNWIREAGLVRGHGWFGGVCVAISDRTGIDPIIVRGLFVVLAVIGFPAILLYALLWLVLPDENGAIQLQELVHGRLHPPLAGIVVTMLFSLIPFSSLLWRVWDALTNPYGAFSFFPADDYYAYPDQYGPFAGAASTLILVLVVGAVTAGATVLIIWLSRKRRLADGPAPTARMSPPTGETPDLATSSLSAFAAPASVPVPAPATAPESALESPNGSADHSGGSVTNEDFSQWRDQHEQTQREHEAYLVDQQTDDSAIARGEEERNSAWNNFYAQVAQRRAARRASNPRASFGYNLGIIGLGIIAACVVALVRLSDGVEQAVAIGAFAGGAVTGVGMVIAGLMKRRSGFLAFATISALVIGAGATVASRPSDIVWDGGYAVVGLQSEVSQPFGSLTISVDPLTGWPSKEKNDLTITKGDGYTVIFVGAGVQLDLNITLGSGQVTLAEHSSDETTETTYELVRPVSTGDTDAYAIGITNYWSGPASLMQSTVTLTQDSGFVEIHVYPDWESTDPSLDKKPLIDTDNR